MTPFPDASLTIALLVLMVLCVVGGIGFPRVVLGSESRRERRRRATRRRLMGEFPGLRHRLGGYHDLSV